MVVQNYDAHVSCRIKKSTKMLMDKHGISPRVAIEHGVKCLLDSDVCESQELAEIDQKIYDAKLDLIVLEMRRDELKSIHGSIHSSENLVG